MKITREALEEFSNSFCMPMTLLINFSLFQYLLTVYYKRWRELRGALLFACAFGGFVTLIPFSNPNEVMVNHLNDISETCSVLTFLIQITILGTDINKKVKIKALKYLTIVSELLILFGLVVMAMNLVEVFFPHIDAPDELDNIMENTALWFIFGFRFMMLVMAKGFWFVLNNKKLEVAMYVLFATHEYPFILLEAETKLPWEDVQALWNRLTIALCVTLTIHEKLRTSDSRKTSRIASLVVSPAAVKQFAVVQAEAMSENRRFIGGRMLRFRARTKPLGIRVGSRRPLAVLGH